MEKSRNFTELQTPTPRRKESFQSPRLRRRRAAGVAQGAVRGDLGRERVGRDGAAVGQALLAAGRSDDEVAAEPSTFSATAGWRQSRVRSNDARRSTPRCDGGSYAARDLGVAAATATGAGARGDAPMSRSIQSTSDIKMENFEGRRRGRLGGESRRGGQPLLEWLANSGVGFGRSARGLGGGSEPAEHRGRYLGGSVRSRRRRRRREKALPAGTTRKVHKGTRRFTCPRVRSAGR